MQVVQAGRGAIRPLVVAYHAGGGLGSSVSPATTILSFQGTPFKRQYASLSADNPLLDDVVQTFAAKLGAEAFWPIVLVGFSEGCQGIRTQLRHGMSPAAILAIDGTHASLPPADWQIDVWRDWFEKCGADLENPPGDDCPPEDAAPIAVVTFTQIPTEQAAPPYMSTRATMEKVTGWSLPPGPAWNQPRVSCSGNVWLYSFPGGNAAAHIQQGTEVLPNALRGLATSLRFGPGGNAPPLPPSGPGGPSRPGAGGPLLGAARALPAAALGAALYLMVRRKRHATHFPL